MFLLSARKVGTTSAASCAEAVAKRAVSAKFQILPALRRSDPLLADSCPCARAGISPPKTNSAAKTARRTEQLRLQAW